MPNTDHFVIPVYLDLSGLSLKQIACIHIVIYVNDSGPESGDSTSRGSDGFLTNHRVFLRKTHVLNKRVLEMLVDDSVKIPLTGKEFTLLKSLIQQLRTDSVDVARPKASVGWVATAELTSNPPKIFPLDKNGEPDTFAKHEIARGVFDLREKLTRSNVSRNLIESGKKGTHSYRISTDPDNVRLDPD